jgi:hypothetical protein
VGARYRRSFDQLASNWFQQNGYLTRGNSASELWLVLVSVIALFEAGQLEVDGIRASTGALHMKRFAKVAVWLAALFLGLFIWNAAPDFRPIVTWLLAAAFICYVLSAIVEITIKRIIWDELLALRRQCDAAVNHLELLDRKVTAILKDALEQRRLR